MPMPQLLLTAVFFFKSTISVSVEHIDAFFILFLLQYALSSTGMNNKISYLNLTVFTDNAHEAVIELYNLDLPKPALVTSLNPTPLPLNSGSMDPVTGFTEVQPYNWQTVRFFTNYTSTLPTSNLLGLVVSCSHLPLILIR